MYNVNIVKVDLEVKRMKKYKLLIILFILFIPILANAKEYYLGNLKIGQRFESGDIIYRSTPPNELSNEPDTLNNLLISESHYNLSGRDLFGMLYGTNFILDEEINRCSGPCLSFEFSSNDEKEYYWILERYEEEEPRSKIAFPLLYARLNASTVTLGRFS